MSARKQLASHRFTVEVAHAIECEVFAHGGTCTCGAYEAVLARVNAVRDEARKR